MADHFDVFISYSRHDKGRMQTIKDCLGKEGWSVFVDEEMPNATRFADYIIHHVNSASCVLVLWSSNTQKSDWVICEASLALLRNKLVHARLDTALPPEMFAHYQAADLINWKGDRTDNHWRNVVQKVATQIRGTRPSAGTLVSPANNEEITDWHLALTSSSWIRTKPPLDPRYPWQIHLMLVGSKEALDRVESVMYVFDPSYGENSPEDVSKDHNEYIKKSSDRSSSFSVYELANGYSVVRALVKIANQAQIVHLSRLVDIMEKGPRLKELYQGN